MSSHHADPTDPAPRAGAHRLMRATMVVLLVLAGTAAPSAGQTAEVRAANKRCLECHGRPDLAEADLRDRLAMVVPSPGAESGGTAARPGLYVPPSALAVGAHAELRCVDCHRDSGVLPHAQVLGPVSCNEQCHTDPDAGFRMSVHAAALEQGDPMAPTCATCHGAHEIRPSSDPRSLSHPFNAVRICGDCHRKHTATTTNGQSPGEMVVGYMDSVHGKGLTAGGLAMAATCSDCHGHHDVRGADDPLATTQRSQIPRTCGRCHVGVVGVYAESVHGRALAAGHELAPVCTDCHAGHQITRASTVEHHLDIVAECGDCHDRPELSGERRASFYKTYRSSYHGQVTSLGSTRAARCSDCHGAHDIQPIVDPASRLYGDNLVRTCARCHEGANARFVQYDPHADYRDRDRYPVLYGVWWYFIIVMSLAFGFFGLHCLLWFGRSLVERLRHGPPHRPAPGTPGIRRFTVINRLNHAIVILTFFGLVLTGIPLLFSEQPWAKKLAWFLGGVAEAGLWHRAFAVLLMINLVVHVFSLLRAGVHARKRGLRQWLFGPDTILPKFRDLRDCAGMMRWFVLGGRKPTFGRWTYWEKFDYWAEIAGTLIIGGSGLMLWFPELFARVMPGWMFNVATIVHGYEALLALGFIFTIHFFNAHLRLEKFPVDDVIFTGQVPVDEFEEERGHEYERLVASDRLDALRAPAPPAWQHTMAVGVGIVAMLIGLILVTLIVLAGLEAI